MISKIKDILRCYATGMGIKGISSAFEISRNTVRRYVHMFQDSGLSMEQLIMTGTWYLSYSFRMTSSRRLSLSLVLLLE